MLGDPRVNQNPALLAFGIIFYRWHNYWAYRIQDQHKDWVDEDVFQAARRRVIASIQVYIEFIVSLLVISVVMNRIFLQLSIIMGNILILLR